MARPRRQRWEDMDHDHEPLLTETVRPHQTDRSGPVAEFLAKKQAEQAPKTYAEYQTVLKRFLAFLQMDKELQENAL
jgi:hypothetical protein